MNNVDNICFINDQFKDELENYIFETKLQENHLTFQEVFDLAREIIESINPKYLEDFDKIIHNGELNFIYESKCKDSSFTHIETNNNIFNYIDINRQYNYVDVGSLVHEFMHYTNGKNIITLNRRIFTEFISIYYENYVIDYLIKKGIPREEIDYEIRLKSTFMSTCKFYTIESPLICFVKFGDVSDGSYEMLKKYYCSIDKDSFNNECNNLLKYFRIKKDNYLKELSLGEKENQFELQENYGIFYSLHCRYLLGTLLAFYARKNCKKENVLYLNEHINDKDIDIFDCLEILGINMNNNNFLNDALDSVIDYINDYDIKKR